MQLTPNRASVALTLFCLGWSGLSLSAQPPSTATDDFRPRAEAAKDEGGFRLQPEKPSATRITNDLDAFMAKVLERRDLNREILQQYILDEVERFELLGPGRLPMYRTRRDFTWYVRDGLHVRSPVRFDGVAVADSARDKYENDWARRERERLERKRKKDSADAGEDDAPVVEPVPVPSGTMAVPTPRFVSEAYFMDFKFEPGNYYLAGREELEGQEVLRIEYYPERMFSGDHERRERERRKPSEREPMEHRVDRQMDKTSLITLWVDPAEHQIVKYTFENVWLDFLPAGWLVRIDDLRASMTMGQPFQGVWLPREMTIQAGVTLANGSFEATYGRAFSEYRQAEVETRIRVPKIHREEEPLDPLEALEPPEPLDPPEPLEAHEPQEPQEVIHEIRVHGNAWLSDAEVIRLAGIEPGQPLAPGGLEQIERRLKDSGRFEAVEVRKRYRSLTSTTDVALVLIVHERPGITLDTQAPGPFGAPWQRFRSRVMFLPILSYADGYGFTYGARFSTVDLLGIDERLSFPLTWGATRRAAVEGERTFDSGPLTRVQSSFGIWQRENPHFGLHERRLEWTGRLERHIARVVRTGVEASRGTVRFGSVDDSLWTIGADAVLDTRGDPSFPRNAVLLGAGWTGLHVRGSAERLDRYTADARGYLGVVGQAVLAARAQYTIASGALPPYERLLVGGSSTLRGFRAGTFAGDRTLVTSAELRLPLTSVLSGARLGVTAFLDAARVYDEGGRFEDAEWHRGAGGGLFLIASVVRVNLDIAHGLKNGRTRAHLSAGFAF